MRRQLQFKPRLEELERELQGPPPGAKTIDEGAPMPQFLRGAGAPPAEPATPSESALAAELAAAAVARADKLEHDVKQMIDSVKAEAEGLEREGLRILEELQARRAAFQQNGTSFLELIGRWRTGLRDVFTTPAAAGTKTEGDKADA